MKELLQRSFFLQKKIIAFEIVFMSFLMFFGDVFLRNNGVFLRIIPSLVFLSVTYVDQLDESTNYTRVLNSLPTSRKDIVNAKYFSALILYFFNLLIVLGFYYGLVSIGWIDHYVTGFWGGVFVSFVISGLLVAISVPVTIIYAYNKSKFINMIMFIMMFNFSNVIITTTNSDTLPNGVGYVMIPTILIMLFLSRVVSINAYLRKEF
ncbi:MAG: ABC-2 transporter permease [Dethiosulfatibacter sp.]|nr:ABC-2 transporter permease [Dethiosulfatibacter sp.]